MYQPAPSGILSGVNECKGYLGRVSFDGRFVTIDKRGHGKQVIPLKAIQAVSIEKAGIGMRAIRFSIAGGSLSGRGPFTLFGSHQQQMRDPFALTYTKRHAAKFEALQREVLEALVAV